MSRVKTIVHAGKNIVYNDFTGFSINTKEELLQTIEMSKTVIAKYQPNTALTLTNFIGMRFDLEMIHIFEEYVLANKPYVKASALLGIEGLKKVAVNAVKSFSSRTDLQLFDDETTALDWLVNQ